MPRPRRPSPFSPSFQAGLPGHRLDHGAGARVLHVGEPEGDRIGAGRRRQLVHEGFEREHVGVGAERAQRRDPDRHVLHEVVDHPLAREVVERDRVAVAAARRLRRAGRRPHLLRLGQVPGRQHVGAGGGGGPGRMAVAPQLVLPVGDPAVGDRGLGPHHHRRTVGLPLELVVAHPLQPHRAAGHRAREQRGVDRDVVGAVVAVAAGSFRMHAADRIGRHLQRLDQLAAQREDALRMRPHRHLAVLEFGERARGPDRAVRHVGLGVDRLECAGICRHRALLDADGRVLARQRLDDLEDAGRIGQLGTGCPFGAL